MKIAIITCLFAKRNMNVNACQNVLVDVCNRFIQNQFSLFRLDLND